MSGLPAASTSLPSIRTRIANALAAWTLVWGLTVAGAVWWAAGHEVNELLDDALQSSAELLALLAESSMRSPPSEGVVQPQDARTTDRFAWQLLAADGTLLLRSVRAPAVSWLVRPQVGFYDVPNWRIYGQLTPSGHTLLLAQTKAERREARSEVAGAMVLAALTLGLMGHVWLRGRVRRELEPLQALSQRLQGWDLDDQSALQPGVLGGAQRSELLPVHLALADVTRRLALRMDNERAFSAHAAHALRTPLAGIDAQLAVVLRDCPMPWHARIQRSRDAAQRLQSVVAALLGLFRSGSKAHLAHIDVDELVQRLPAPRLQLHTAPGMDVLADADLLAAALLNLLDNAQRHGAANVWIDQPAAGTLRVRDDGPGLSPQRRELLQSAIDQQRYDGVTGLGLMLTDRVARLHGGSLKLGPAGPGLSIELCLGASD
jgi:signal transduction histidine kinase